jgi:hypothetical protein
MRAKFIIFTRRYRIRTQFVTGHNFTTECPNYKFIDSWCTYMSVLSTLKGALPESAVLVLLQSFCRETLMVRVSAKNNTVMPHILQCLS